MLMISTVKLHRVDTYLLSLRPYFLNMESILSDLTSFVEVTKNIFFEERPRQETKVLCVVTSDEGLCGLYNANIINIAEKFIQDNSGSDLGLVIVGRNGLKHFKNRHIEILDSFVGLNGRYTKQKCDAIASNLIDLFVSGRAGQVYIAYTHCNKAFLHKPALAKFLNIERSQPRDMEYLLEPDTEGILERLIPQYLLTKMRLMILESFISEHASRMVAMKSATDNAEDLLQELTLMRNKVRQSGITTDIMEIVASSEAVKG